MYNQLLKAVCELSEKVEQMSPSPGNGVGDSLGRISTSISPVAKQGTKPVKLIGPNPNRVGVIVHNNSLGELMIALDPDKINGNYYTFKIRAGETLHYDIKTYGELFKGGMMGLWDETTGAEATSKALVTEIYWGG